MTGLRIALTIECGKGMMISDGRKTSNFRGEIEAASERRTPGAAGAARVASLNGRLVAHHRQHGGSAPTVAYCRLGPQPGY